MNPTHLATEIFDFAGKEEPMRPSRPGRTGYFRHCPFNRTGSRREILMGALRLADNPKTETTLQPSDLAQLRQTIRGGFVSPADSGYEQARRVWNGMVDKRPAAVIYWTGSDDVITAVNFARTRNLLVAVRGGGHHRPRPSVCAAGSGIR